MSPLLARRLALAFACAGLLAVAAPAKSEVEPMMRQCDMKLCAYYRASIKIPDGWVENKEASRELGVQMLLPRGQEFEAAPSKIYVLVRFDKKPLSAIRQQAYKDWHERAKNGKVEKLADVARDSGKPAFERHQFDAPKLKEQGFEVTSLVADTDKSGRDYVVVFVLTANTREALKSAEASYLSILKAY
jgi:hypothetical protein